MNLRSLANPGPREFFIFAAVLAIFFLFGFKKKPEPNEDGQGIWWTAMTVFGLCIVYLVLKGFGISLLG